MSTPTINVNLKPCDCPSSDVAGQRHETSCASAPILIPCAISRSVAFEVRLGECTCALSLTPQTAPEWHHTSRCPARPIRVVCDIGGETWAESEVITAETGTEKSVPHFRFNDPILTACRERWALAKALVLGRRGMEGFTPPPWCCGLMFQRDSVFAALAEMARAEQAAVTTQQRVDAAFPYSRFAAPDDNDHRKERPSVGRLAAYVKFIVEEVGRHG